MSSINSMTQYLDYFGIKPDTKGAKSTGIIFVGFIPRHNAVSYRFAEENL